MWRIGTLLALTALVLTWQNCAQEKKALLKGFDSSGRLILPPYENFRTDYDSPSEGTTLNPLQITSCAIQPPVEWQAGVCSQTATLPRTYASANAYNVGRGFSRYWVLHVNDEGAFQTTNFGPPSQSLPVNGTNAWVLPDPSGIELGLKNNQSGAEAIPGGTPFVSFGMQVGRGDFSGLPHARYKVSFDVTINNLAPSATLANSIHFWVESQNTGNRVWSWIYLAEKHTGASMRMNWNWPIQESMWFPGAYIDFEIAENFASRCGKAYNQIPLYPAPIAQTFHYDIDLENLVGCLSGLGPGTPITGIHFGIEQNGPTLNYMYVTFRNISVVPK